MAKPFELVSKLTEVGEKRPTFLAIGVFDGVHLGHQNLLQSMASAAIAESARPAVLTFYPHPITLINGRRDRLYLSTLEERIELLAEQGLELVITLPFDENIRRTPAADFINQLCQNLDLSQLWGGAFGLGYNREGDLTFLRRLGQEKGYTIHQFEAMVKWNDQRVSSSRVRRALRQGDMDDVSGCLGRLYCLTGTVIPGDGRGRTLGIPTANLSVWDEQMLPATGVYATYAWLDGNRYAAATNVGYRPTVDGHTLNVETHLLDFNADIYGKELTLSFVSRIRDEQKFSGLEALIVQIQLDITTVRQHLQLETY